MSDERRASVALFLLAMGVLVLEVTLTRIFSVMTWHHFAYLIISLALLSFGAASTFLTVSPRFAGRSVNAGLVARYALAFSLATVLCLATATKIRFYPLDAYTYGDYSNVFSLFLLYVVVGVPFFFAGVAIGYLISRAGEAINRLYFADLFGAGTGALLAIAGINRLGAEATIYAVGAVGAIVAVLYSSGGGRRLRAGAAGALALCVLMTVVGARREIFPVYFPPEKIFRDAMEPHYYRWHTIARVDVLKPTERWWSFGGALSPTYQGVWPKVRGIYQDGAAPTGIMEVPGGDVNALSILGYYLQGAPYILKPRPEQALVIGVGGGIDVLIALYHGARRVVGVELNPVTIDAVRREFADFAGRIFDRPDVEIVNGEGRHYLTASDRQFDVIQLSGVDTYAAASSGAYALSENFLYTLEAMRDYWDHLRPEGVLSFSRWLFTPPRETLRLVAIQLEALRRLGVERPDRHFMVFCGRMWKGESLPPWAETLLKKAPFSEAEAASCRQWAERMGFTVLYDPYRPYEPATAKAVDAFETHRSWFDRLIRASDAERATIIDRYMYNIRPISDDDPFFFQFYRWSNLLRSAPSQGGYAIERVPLGIAILLVSLVQILLLAAVFIIGPLVPQGAALRQVPHKARLLVYFGALGLGFISVEISLLQKYTVFVGGPVYAMAVTLFAILVFSGLGSWLAQRAGRSIATSLALILIALAIVLIAEIVFANHVVPRLMFLSHAARCVVAVLALAPLALLMGMPFPTGLRVAQRLGDAVVPWAWGVNAAMTTLGAILCVIVSIQWGFTATLLAAGVVYLLALAALRPVARTVAP